MAIAITGASGFIGRALGAALTAAGRPWRALDVRAPLALSSADTVVHLAAIAHARHTSRAALQEINVELTRRIGGEVAGVGARMLFLSSVKVHGERSFLPLNEQAPLLPTDAYGESKAQAEQLLAAMPGLRLTVLRPPLVYGPGVKANFLALMNALARGWPLPFAGLDNRRSFIFVGNLVDAIIRGADARGTFLVSDGEALSTAQLCRELAAALHRPARLFPFPSGLLPSKLAGSLEVDDSAIRRALGWQPPFSRKQGLRATAEWYRGR